MSETKSENESEYTGKVNLVSSEGDMFKVEANVAAMSELVKTMLLDDDDEEEEEGEEETEQEIPLPNVKSDVLAKVVEFCNYRVKNGPMKEIEKPLKSANMAEVVGEWDAIFVGIEQEILFNLILAANYMDIKSLLDLTCAKVASIIKSKLDDPKDPVITTKIFLMDHLKIRILNFLSYKDIIKIKDDNSKNRLEGLKEIIDEHFGRNVIPIDCVFVSKNGIETLNKAYERVENSNGALTTIMLGQGTHVVDGSWLKIKCPVNIVGSPDVSDKKTIIVQGGISIDRSVNGTVHVEHLTIRGSKGYSGVKGYSSFTLNDLIIEQCGGSGVYARDSSTIGRCSNVVIRKCQYSGVCVYSGASIILEGRETSIYENCSGGNMTDYGLAVWHPSSKIQIVSPLTKESISERNGGGGNWGAEVGANINQIEIIEETTTSKTNRGGGKCRRRKKQFKKTKTKRKKRKTRKKRKKIERKSKKTKRHRRKSRRN